MDAPRLSVVVPVFNETAVLVELAQRCSTAARESCLSYEVIVVDDASTDGTQALSAGLGSDVRVERLPQNAGQLRATLHGLRVARGSIRVVLDGDLQDPPELIGPLAKRLLEERPQGVHVVFAVKSDRDDPWLFRLGRQAFDVLMRVPGAQSPPPGAGSYCAMTSELADAVAAMPTRWGNLASLVAVQRPRHALLRYEKRARVDGSSRVGAMGLVREALYSLLLSDALGAWAFWLGIGPALLVGVDDPSLRPAMATVAGTLWSIAALSWLAARALRGTLPWRTKP